MAGRATKPMPKDLASDAEVGEAKEQIHIFLRSAYREPNIYGASMGAFERAFENYNNGATGNGKHAVMHIISSKASTMASRTFCLSWLSSLMTRSLMALP